LATCMIIGGKSATFKSNPQDGLEKPETLPIHVEPWNCLGTKEFHHPFLLSKFSSQSHTEPEAGQRTSQRMSMKCHSAEEQQNRERSS